DGPLTFERPEVLERIRLDPFQIEQIQAVLADGRSQLSPGVMVRTSVAGPGPGGAAPSPKDLEKALAKDLKQQRERRQKEPMSAREQMMQALSKLLTRGQRATYRSMLGEPFDLKKLQSDPTPRITINAGPTQEEQVDQPATKDSPTPTPRKGARPK